MNVSFVLYSLLKLFSCFTLSLINKMSVFIVTAVNPVLELPHKLEGADLAVMPYFDFLQPTERLTSQASGIGSQEMTERNSEDLSDNQMQTSPPVVAIANSQSSSQTSSEPLAAQEAVEEASGDAIEDQMEEEDTLSDHIPIADPAKLALFQLSTFQQDSEKAHPDVTIQIKDNGVHIAGTDRQTFEQIKHTILDYFGKMAETHFTLEPEKAQFLERKDVKKRLLQIMGQTESPAMYTVSDCNVAVTSLSQNSANQACNFLKSQLCHFSIPLDREYEGMLNCREWSEFVQALGFSSVKVSEQGRNADVLTLKGMESEKQTAILQFLATPIERETVISMEPGVLKYIQTHCHQLLADMDEVSIFPLEAEEVCGLKVRVGADMFDCSGVNVIGFCFSRFRCSLNTVFEIAGLLRLFHLLSFFVNVPDRSMALQFLVKWLRRCCRV